MDVEYQVLLYYSCQSTYIHIHNMVYATQEYIDRVQLQIECTTTQVMTPFPPLTFHRCFFRSIDPILASMQLH